jgi:hypothetical protein
MNVDGQDRGMPSAAGSRPADTDVYMEARQRLVRRHAEAGERGGRWASDVPWPSDLPADLRERFSSLAAMCRDLDDVEIALVLERIARNDGNGEHERESALVTIELIGARGRLVDIRECDPILPQIQTGVLTTVRITEDVQEITVAAGASLLVDVSTDAGEPRVQIPIDPRIGDVQQIDLMPLRPLYAPVRLRYIPQVTCRIGADLLARNTLPATTVTFGPVAVQEAPLTIDEFVSLNGDPSRCRFMGREVFDSNLRPDPTVVTSRAFDGGRFPVVGLDLKDAQSFIGSISAPSRGRWDLLNEREWEALFRGPERFVYPWGREWLSGAANVLDGGLPALEPVGVRPLDLSRWGLRDGAGNVEEWTAPGEEIVAKGGSWYNDKQVGRCASRVVRAPEFRHPKLGLRLAVRL